jgi:hypothetical protein
MNQENNKKPKKSEYDFVTPFVALLVLGLIGYGAQYWYNNVRKPSSYSVCLQGYNYTDRAISDFYVNGAGGGNISSRNEGWPYGGGGGLSCGTSVKGLTATVRWEYSLPNWQDYEKHIKPETHEVTVPMPIAQSNYSRYFQVRIFPDNHVELKLVDTFEDRNAEETELLKKLYKQREDIQKQEELAINVEEAEIAKKFDEENEASYQRYKAEHDKKTGVK